MTRDSLNKAALDSLRMNRNVVVVVLAYIATVFIVGRLAGFDVELGLYNATWMLTCFVSFCIILIPYMVWQLWRHRPRRRLRFLWELLLFDLRLVERCIVAFPCILLFAAFLSAFTSIKSSIAQLHDYHLDPLFAQIDRIIHGGHAWELIHPIVGFPAITHFLNAAYAAAFLLGWIILVVVMFMTSNRELREQYLLAFCGSWILLGSIAAVGLSSVGPCFYGLLYPTDPYAPLMNYLRSVLPAGPFSAVGIQEVLWERYISNSPGIGSGISAMPSMHVAKATLNAILLSKLSRTAGILGWIYLVVTLVASVHLGWHYAIDGYVAIVGVLVIWRAAGWWVARSTSPAPVPVGSAQA